MTIATLTTFFGWCTVLNFGFLLFATIAVTLFREPAMRLHAKLTGVAEAELPKRYFDYLANYKLLALTLSFVPWLALTIMAP